MINSKYFCDAIVENGIKFVSGVPDSTFGDLPDCIQHHDDIISMIAVNECEAIAHAAGHHLATGKTGMVYMQNSGLGGALDPLTSLCNSEVYKVPVLLLIGLRGEEGQVDEPQHLKMGRVTQPILDTLGIKYELLSDDASTARDQLARGCAYTAKESAPFAVIVRKGAFKPSIQKESSQVSGYIREDAIKTVIKYFQSVDIVVATTGKISRELYELRDNNSHGHENDFHVIGSMGCAGALGLSIAKEKPDKKVMVLDGDGALLMHMGTLSTIGHYAPSNFYHVVLDNEAHDSTGGQPTVSGSIDFAEIALGCGYKEAVVVKDAEALTKEINRLQKVDGPVMIVVKVAKGSRPDLGRPKETPSVRKKSFMNYLNEQ